MSANSSSGAVGGNALAARETPFAGLDLPDDGDGASGETPDAMMERLVDAVVDKLEQRVIEELERRGHRQSWAAF